ncbi:iron-containing redox enzyme family protein [Candidatus Paracaedibacter symbiosus]|uniref:iron-containing redox enzyme family protein n=1 Tax=Candidatus Paracaedibacter symbiosus TaxID=244582 RepID=UPI000509DC4F|nr:iron-containing redox enzyme family protein [Candidatus Paracaedibacter symbiosus]
MQLATSSTSTQEDFLLFLQQWDQEYSASLSRIDLFNSSLTAQWKPSQKIYFAKLFYHVRGHFIDFLWLLGNHASDKTTKDIILANLAEEFNSSAKSHEQMYIDFATSIEADLSEEIIENKYYLPFIQEYNKDHLRWLINNNEEKRFSAFSAYERLDNVDYKYLAELATSLKASRKGLVFFKVHLKAQHFGNTEDYLFSIWQENSACVKESFNFIGNHQLKMWKNLSDNIFGYTE